MSAVHHGLDELGIGRLFDLIPDALVIVDAVTGRVEHWNPGATDVFGHALEDAIGMNIDVLVPPELLEAHRAGVARFARDQPGPLTEQQLAAELPALTADGRRIWVELRLSALPVIDAEQRLVLAIIRDVTDRHDLQEEQRTAAADEEARSDQLRRFVSMAAHDLRAPLSLVNGFLDTASMVPDNPAMTADMIGRAKTQAELVTQLSGDILESLRLEAGVETPVPSSVDLAILLPLTVGGEGVELQCAPGARVMADERHLQRMVHNLVSNAQKYGRPPITITVQREEASIVIDVRDHGPGVRVDDVPSIFEPFVRAGDDTTIAGSGLGLAIVRRLAALNGGTVDHEPAEPGARFVIRLPAAAA